MRSERRKTRSKSVTYGYVRVSSKEQNLDRQFQAMKKFGIPPRRIYEDKISGKDFHRPAYNLLLGILRPRDVIVIQSIDRLGRNYDEILEQWRIIIKEKRVAIVVLDMPLLDTRQGRDLTGTLIADIVLQLLSYVAQKERECIRERQAEGIAAAKAKGVHLGRFPKPKPRRYREIYVLWKKGALSARGAARRLGVCHKTFLKWTLEVDNSEDADNPDNMDNPEDTEDADNMDNPEDTENAGNVENSENAGNAENPDNMENVEDAENSVNVANVEDAEDVCNAENAGNAGNVSDAENEAWAS